MRFRDFVVLRSVGHCVNGDGYFAGRQTLCGARRQLVPLGARQPTT